MSIEGILKRYKIIAVVGCSRDPSKPSNSVPAYLKSKGYTIIPINPHADEILGEKAYPSLDAYPGEIEIVEIFRPSDQVGPIVDEAIEKGVKVIWMQEGIANKESAEKAEKAGIEVVTDKCMFKELEALG